MPSLLNIALVFLGGGIGSVGRFMASAMLAERFGTAFPFATLMVNCSGSFCIGVVVALAGDRVGALSDEWRFFLAVGFCGGFTTFSTFSLETLALMQSGRIISALAYSLASVLFCVIGTGAGLGLVYWWAKRVGG